MRVITAPEPLIELKLSVFLAGSIEQDQAEKWQDLVIEQLKGTNLTLLNPRRLHWDPYLEQQADNPAFAEQVNWELEALEKAQRILMYFAPSTKSPISLLELGLFAQSNKLMVCCPDGFWRKGNVDLVCRRYQIPQYPDLNSMIQSLSVDLEEE